MKEYEVGDFRYDEGWRTRKDKQIVPTIPAWNSESLLSGMPLLVERERESKAVACAMRGREEGQKLEVSDREEANAITTIQKDSMVADVRIRKLTPRECWRLMGFTDEEFDRAKEVVSDTQLYRQAGNSICVDTLAAIMRELL